MKLTRLILGSFRNIQQLELPISERFTLIHGKNGSGKTSILEALYLMSCGKSFRATHLSQLTARGSENFLVRLGFSADQGDISAGLQRDHAGGGVTISINQSTAKFTELAQLLPIRMIGPIDTINLVLGGPEKRRHFLDWGLFHVKHYYWEIVKRLNKIIKQKNAALKGRCSHEELKEWNKQLGIISIEMDTLRKAYFSQWIEIHHALMQGRDLFEQVHFSYYPGWEGGENLLDLLGRYAQQEREAGHCLIGPQRADIRMFLREGIEVKEYFSRGQQKLLAISMFLSQGELLYQTIGRHPVYLVDDFTSELDQDSQQLLLDLLNTGNKQVILTALDIDHPAIRALAEEDPIVVEIVEGALLIKERLTVS